MAKLEIREDVSVEDLTDEEKEALKETARRVMKEGEELQDVLGITDDYVETMEFYAHHLYKHNKMEEAGTLLEGVIALDKTRHYPYLLAGDIAMQEEQWEDAIQLLGAALHFGPEDPMIEGKLGESLLRAGRTKDAVFHLKKAIVFSDDDDDKYARRSRVLLELVKEEVGDVKEEDVT